MAITALKMVMNLCETQALYFEAMYVCPSLTYLKLLRLRKGGPQ